MLLHGAAVLKYTTTKIASVWQESFKTQGQAALGLRRPRPTAVLVQVTVCLKFIPKVVDKASSQVDKFHRNRKG